MYNFVKIIEKQKNSFPQKSGLEFQIEQADLLQHIIYDNISESI
jgi:hypothetical protein